MPSLPLPLLLAAVNVPSLGGEVQHVDVGHPAEAELGDAADHAAPVVVGHRIVRLLHTTWNVD